MNAELRKIENRRVILIYRSTMERKSISENVFWREPYFWIIKYIPNFINDKFISKKWFHLYRMYCFSVGLCPIDKLCISNYNHFKN